MSLVKCLEPNPTRDRVSAYAMHMTVSDALTAKLDAAPGSRTPLEGNQVPSFRPQRRIPINELSAVCQKLFPRCIHKVTNKISSSRARKRPRRQVSLPSSSTALRPPPSPTRPESSTVIGSRSGSSSTTEKHARRRAGKKLTNRRRCTSSAQYPTMTAD